MISWIVSKLKQNHNSKNTPNSNENDYIFVRLI
nr:MAG TPA_asm: hypothetical protein [Bacteriophage sp.]